MQLREAAALPSCREPAHAPAPRLPAAQPRTLPARMRLLGLPRPKAWVVGLAPGRLEVDPLLVLPFWVPRGRAAAAAASLCCSHAFQPAQRGCAAAN